MLVFIVPNRLDIAADLDDYANKADETAERYKAVHPEIGDPHTKGNLMAVFPCIIGAIPDHYPKDKNDHGEIKKIDHPTEGPGQGIHNAVYLHMVIAEYTKPNPPKGGKGKHKGDEFFHFPERNIKTVTGNYRKNHTKGHQRHGENTNSGIYLVERFSRL
jgi:hypothetical protein